MVTFLDNLFLGIALALPLGPVTLEILRRGLQLNFLESIKTAIGAFSAELTYFIIVYLGLASLSNYFSVKISLGILGIGFLGYLSAGNIADFINKVDYEKKKLIGSSFNTGYLVTFLNPMNFFMWAGIIGGFFAQNTSLWVSSGVLFGIFPCLFAYSFFSLGRKFLNKKILRYISLIAGLFLAYYAINFIIQLVFSIYVV